jgi:large subunit ribosomal protein L23
VTFEVAKNANRIEIKKAVEELFKVNVDSVKTLQVKGKKKQRGRISGKRRDWKKAVVKLMPGDKIEIFEGV